MDHGDRYTLPQVQSHLLPRKPLSPYESYSHETSSTTLPKDPYAYQPYGQPSSEKVMSYTTPVEQPHGIIVHSAWRRYLFVWLLAFFAVCAFVGTTIFAWNATGGDHADPRFLFDDPGKTILTLQLLTNLTTALFGELIITSFEALRWALATGGTRFTTFLGLSRATSMYGMVILIFGKHVSGYTRFWVFQRGLVYALVFASSFVLLSQLTLPLSYPVLTSIANGTAGLGDFGSTVPTFSLPAFHFSNYVQDSSQVFGVESPCTEDGCVSYYLAGGLSWVNGSMSHISQGVAGLNNISFNMGAGNLGALTGLGGVLGASSGDQASLAALLNGNSSDSSGLLASLLGGTGSSAPLAGLLGGTSTGNDSSANLLGGLLDGNSSGSGSVDGLFGGLKKRQGDSPLGTLGANYQSMAQQMLANTPNWTAYNANQTRDHGIKDSQLAYIAYNALGYRLDFSPFSGPWPQHNRHCSTYSTAALLNISLTACIATETNSQNVSTIIGGLRICDPNLGLFGPTCEPESSPDDSPMQYTTQLHLQRSRATTACSLRNATIISVQNESKPIDYPVPVTWFFESFTAPLEQSKLFALMQSVNNAASSSVTSQLTLSLAADFAYAGMGPLDGAHQVRNMMAAAISSGTIMQDNIANSGPQAVTKMVYTVRIAPATLYAFIILGTLILLWCIPVLVWSNFRCTANASGFPEVDFATKWAGASTMAGLSNAESGDVIRRLGGSTNVFVGEGTREGIDGDAGKEAIVLDTAPVTQLRKGVEYF